MSGFKGSIGPEMEAQKHNLPRIERAGISKETGRRKRPNATHPDRGRGAFEPVRSFLDVSTGATVTGSMASKSVIPSLK